MTRLNDGLIHRILFSQGALYLDGVKIAGKGMEPEKDVVFEFQVADTQGVEESPPTLEINVHDAIKGKSVGPGQL